MTEGAQLSQSRSLSALEFLLGAAVVIAHNVFRAVPNEVSILFGYGHFYKGPAGIIDSGVAGLILGSAYMLAGRNLWASVLAHGFIDTFGVVMLYFGLDT